jgi:hypothetical protein
LRLLFTGFGAGGVCAGTFDSAVGIFVYDFRVIFLGVVAAENAGAHQGADSHKDGENNDAVAHSHGIGEPFNRFVVVTGVLVEIHLEKGL